MSQSTPFRTVQIYFAEESLFDSKNFKRVTRLGLGQYWVKKTSLLKEHMINFQKCLGDSIGKHIDEPFLNW